MSSNAPTGSAVAATGSTGSTARSATSTTRGSRPRGHRGNRSRGTNAGSTASTTRRTTSFKGNTAEMNGNVFECHEEQDDHLQYSKTVECLDAYTKTNLTFPIDLALLFATPIGMPSVPGQIQSAKTLTNSLR